MESPCFNTISDRRSLSLWTRQRYSQTPPPPFSTWFSNLFTSSSSVLVTIFFLPSIHFFPTSKCCCRRLGKARPVYWICFCDSITLPTGPSLISNSMKKTNLPPYFIKLCFFNFFLNFTLIYMNISLQKLHLLRLDGWKGF